MNTLELNPSIDLPAEETATKITTKAKSGSIYKKFTAFAESQTEKRTGWFLIALLGPGVLFLPVPAVLMYYFDAPIWTLATTVLLFFASLIAGMGGSKVGVLIGLLGLNIVAHLLMLMIFVL